MLAAATDLFSERGFAAVSMDDVAHAAGITKPLVYSYFGSKEGLFAACAERAGGVLRAQLRSLIESSELAPDERLWAGITTVFEFVEHHRRSWALLYPAHGRPSAGVAEGADHAREAMERLLESLFADTARGAGVGGDALAHVGPLARAFTAATIAMAADWVSRSEEPRELAALRLMNLAWLGFGGLLAGRMWLPGADDGGSDAPG
jgi:AcrR family transcriptional regulator